MPGSTDRIILTCSACGVRTEAVPPTDACQFFWDCPACGVVVRPTEGDCCVFCSYGEAPCPPVRHSRAAAQSSCC